MKKIIFRFIILIILICLTGGFFFVKYKSERALLCCNAINLLILSHAPMQSALHIPETRQIRRQQCRYVDFCVEP